MRFGARSLLLSRLSGSRSRTAGGVALTFDDGPMPGTTDRVLDVLSDLDVRATFFCVGRNASRHPQLLRRIQAEGHAVGSHSNSHAGPRALPVGRLAQDYVDGRKAVEDVLGVPVPLFRPPYGRLLLRTARLMRSYDSWIWSVDPADWAATATPEGLVAALGSTAAGDVVLFHDWVEPAAPHSRDRSATTAAVEHLVTRLRDEGVPLVTLTEDVLAQA